ncbi:hypothetical protein QYF36_015289 [Acer negundo]|nr:hypothetical protein QYF36_015289 [Acer negundo]
MNELKEVLHQWAKRDELIGGNIQNGDKDKGKRVSVSSSTVMAKSLTIPNRVARNLGIRLGEEVLPLKEKIISDSVGPKSIPQLQESKANVGHMRDVELGRDGLISEPLHFSKISLGSMEKKGPSDGKMHVTSGDSSVGRTNVLSAMDINKGQGDHA